MKNLVENIAPKNRFAILIFLIFAQMSKVNANQILYVAKLKGNAFATTPSEKTVFLEVGMQIGDLSEIVTELNSDITLIDYYQNEIRLAGGSQLYLMGRIYELKRGAAYIRTDGNTASDITSFKMSTANSIIPFSRGEMIVTFDPTMGSTQLVVVRGKFDLISLQHPELKSPVVTGEFSILGSGPKSDENSILVLNDMNRILPREATIIGEESYKHLMALFPGIRTETERGVGPKSGRMPASSETGEEIIFIPKGDKVVKVDLPVKIDKFIAKEQRSIKRQRLSRDPRTYAQVSEVPFKIYGAPHSHRSKRKQVTPSRMPASVPSAVVERTSREKIAGDTKALIQDLRHQKETRALIEELKSLKMDFRPTYP